MKNTKKFDLNFYALCAFLSNDYYTNFRASQLFRDELKTFVDKKALPEQKSDTLVSSIISVCNEIIYFITDKNADAAGLLIIQSKTETLKFLNQFYMHIKYERKLLRQRVYNLNQKLKGILPVGKDHKDYNPDHPYTKIEFMFEIVLAKFEVVLEENVSSTDQTSEDTKALATIEPKVAKPKIAAKKLSVKRKYSRKSNPANPKLKHIQGSLKFDRSLNYLDDENFKDLSADGLIALAVDLLGEDHPKMEQLLSLSIDLHDDHLNDKEKSKSASELSREVHGILYDNYCTSHELSDFELTSSLTEQTAELVSKLFKTNLLGSNSLISLIPVKTRDGLHLLRFTLNLNGESVYLNLFAGIHEGKVEHFMSLSTEISAAGLVVKRPEIEGYKICAIKNLEGRDLFHAFLRVVRDQLLHLKIKTHDSGDMWNLMSVLCDNNLLRKQIVEVAMYI
jgi:hypothetical protein